MYVQSKGKIQKNELFALLIKFPNQQVISDSQQTDIQEQGIHRIPFRSEFLQPMIMTHLCCQCDISNSVELICFICAD